MFVTLKSVDVRKAPGLDAEIEGQVGAGQQINVVGLPVVRDNIMWHNVEGVGDLWIPERVLDGSTVFLEWQGSEPKPGSSDVTVDPTKLQTRESPRVAETLPENVDIDPTDYDRTRRASYYITRAFEGGFSSYQTYDTGIVSYGFLQFTLGSGSLQRVIDRFLAMSQSALAGELRSGYLGRVRSKDTNLRSDMRFKELLMNAADEKEMREAQFDAATEDYWDVVIENYVQRRGNLRYPLTYALLFDMGVNFGVNHPYARQAEEAYGVPSNSRVGDNGITEEQLTSKIAELRRDSHYRQAERDNLPGLKVRGDFWVNLTKAGDWFLQGDADGFVEPKPGRKVQVRNPE